LSQRPTEAKAFKSNKNDGLLNARTWLKMLESHHYERLPENHEGMIYVVMIRLMLRRLAKTVEPGNLKQLNQRLQTLSWY